MYQAAFRAATALVRAGGYRIRGAVGGHHYATFYAAGALGDDELENVADAMQNVRGGRHAALYGDEDEVEPEDLEGARERAGRLLALVHATPIAQRPSLAARPRSLFRGVERTTKRPRRGCGVGVRVSSSWRG